MQHLPEWMVEKYGRSRARQLMADLWDRYKLVTFNARSEYPKQVEFLRAVLEGKHKIYAWVGGNRCLAGEQMVFDPVLGASREVSSIPKPFNCLSWDGSRVVTGTAYAPFRKGEDEDLFEVTFNTGGKVRCSLGHTFLTLGGWVPLSAISMGERNPLVHVPMERAGTEKRRGRKGGPPRCYIEKVEYLRRGPVWDFTVLEHHNYVVGGVVNHNSGKTTLGAVATICHATGIRPWCLGGSGWEDRFHKNGQEPRPWVVGLDFPGCRDILRPKIEEYLPKSMLKQWRQADQIYTLSNGVKIGMKSADSGREKFQGVSRTLIWLDEECDESIFEECLARTVDCGGILILTYTPVNGFSWSYDRIWKRSETDDDIFLMNSTMADNPYIPRREIERFSEQCSSNTMKKIRVSGLYALLSGSNVFSSEHLQEMRDNQVMEPIRVESTIGLSIWEDPEKGTPYVIGVDTGKGKQKGDFSAAVVMDTVSRSVVAMIRDRVDAETFGARVADLARRYNGALVNPEKQDHGIVTINAMKRAGYARIWRPRKIARLESKTSSEMGFSTDIVGKPLLVSLLQSAIREKRVFVPSKVLVEELSTYIWYDQSSPKYAERHKVVGKCGAMHGKHDDTVIALGLCLVAAGDLHRSSASEAMGYTASRVRPRKTGTGGVALVVDRKYYPKRWVLGSRR